MKNIPIIGKIAIVVLSLSLVAVLSMIYSTAQMRDIDERYSAVIEGPGKSAFLLARTNRALALINLGISNAVIADTAERNDAAGKALAAARESFVGFIDGAIAIGGSAASKPELMALKAKVIDLVDRTCAKAVGMGLAAVTPEAVALSQNEYQINCQPQFAPLTAAIAVQADGAMAMQDRENEALSTLTGSTVTMTYMLVLGGLLAAAAGALFIARRSISTPLNDVSKIMGRLADNDLTVTPDGTERKDEIGTIARAVLVFKENALRARALEAEALAATQAQEAQRNRQSSIDTAKAEDLRTFVHAVEAGFDGLSSGDLTIRINQTVAREFEPIRAKFNESVAELETAIGAVVTGIGSMKTGLSEISIASADLSQRTEQQAASLEETVAALAEVTRGIDETARGAIQAQGSAGAAQKNAEKGGEIVGRAVAAMGAIERSSDQIGKIIGVIDEIAFQTNLLALNAGVEAARAGEAGRGFAVVAQEVRGLAQRSAEAAKEIKSLISTSSAQVAEGVELVTATGRSLGEIVSQVAEMSAVVSGIAQSAGEQAISLKEVSTAADQMDKVTQQNAAMVEETTAAAQALTSETEELAELVQRFSARTSGSIGPRNSLPATRRPVVSPSTPQQARPVTQMRKRGPGNAVPKVAADEWAEF
jgi:methyl-accepting chemotaxis protein